MSQKTIDFQKILNNQKYGFSSEQFDSALNAMKQACIQAIELAYEDAAENAKVETYNHVRGGELLKSESWVDKESILSRKDILIERLKLK